MKGSPAKMGMIQGTAGHASALKMKAEADAASALKQMTLSKDELKDVKWQSGANIGSDVTVSATGKEMTVGGKTMPTKGEGSSKTADKILEKRWEKGDKASGGTLNDLVKQRKGLKKGSAEYAEVQNKINKALGSKKVHTATTTATNTTTKNKPKSKIDKVVQKGEDKKAEIADKASKLTGEVKENVSKKTAKITRRGAKKEFGKGSKEHLAAKQAHLVAKEADRQGEEGGRKQGIFRRLSSKINKKRQAKNQAKIDAANAEETPVKIYDSKGKRRKNYKY